MRQCQCAGKSPDLNRRHKPARRQRVALLLVGSENALHGGRHVGISAPHAHAFASHPEDSRHGIRNRTNQLIVLDTRRCVRRVEPICAESVATKAPRWALCCLDIDAGRRDGMRGTGRYHRITRCRGRTGTADSAAAIDTTAIDTTAIDTAAVKTKTAESNVGSN
jgi:hypothetical protein